MAVDFSNGIAVASGFSLQAKVPLDGRVVVNTLADLNELVKANATYEGLRVFCKEDQKFYFRTDVEPTGEDFTGCWKAELGDVATADNVVTLSGDQTVGGVKTFTTAPKIGAETATTKEYVDTQIPTVITSKVGTELQAHSDQLDKLSALSDVGFISREADGSMVGFGIEAGDASVTVTKDDTAKKVKVALPSVGTAGSYFKVTTDAQGRVTAGENPTTVDGFGITDAVKNTGDILTGKLTYQGVDLGTLGENDLVPKLYADSVALGYDVHVACETGSSTNIQGTYADGTVNPDYVGVGATLTLEASITAIGGVTLAVGQRVLLVGQTDKKQNGAYSVKSLAPVVLERVEDFDGHPTITYKGASFLIAEGDLKGTVWRLMNDGMIVFGTDDINFAQAFAPNSIKAGDGIAVSGTTVSVKQGSTVKVIGGNLEVSSGTGNTGKILTAGADGTTAQWKAIETSDLPQNVVLTDAEQTITNKTISAKTVAITDTTDATSASTGALTVAGGVGIAHDLHIGGNIVGATGSKLENFEIDAGEY